MAVVWSDVAEPARVLDMTAPIAIVVGYASVHFAKRRDAQPHEEPAAHRTQQALPSCRVHRGAAGAALNVI